MWYKYAQKEEIPPEQWGVSHKQVDDMIQRLWGMYGHYYKENGMRLKDISDDQLAMEADNDFEIYNRYLSNLPEGVRSTDLLKAYREGLLPQYLPPPQRTSDFDISNAPDIETSGLPWQPQSYSPLDDRQLFSLFELAKNRQIPSNKEKISDARYQIFLASFKDPTICERLGVKQPDLNKLLRSWTNIPARSVELEKRLNQTSGNLTTEWNGISNSSFIAQSRVNPEDMDGFFRYIRLNPVSREIAYVEGSDTPIDLQAEWNNKRGEALRKYILRTVLAIDTHIKYEDLAFEITNVLDTDSKTARGVYISQKKLIEIKKTHPNTVSHEIGHYLDNKWAEDLAGENRMAPFLSDATFNVDLVLKDEQSKQFYRIFQEFVMDISERSNISSEYFQRRREVFARFIAKFVEWVNGKSGWGSWKESYYRDSFNENDYLKFIRILQMKSFLDASKV